MQDKLKEIAFFNRHAVSQEYDVFSEESNHKLIETLVQLSGWRLGAKVADLGCGSGVFTNLLQKRGFNSFGIDLSYSIMAVGRSRFVVEFVTGDVESLPLRSESLDGVLLSGILHHLPELSACASEVFRVLKPKGTFVAFDPNRGNPFMWVYRDKSSLFYSRRGVTENERPIVGSEAAEVFCNVGFRVKTEYISGLSYRYIASPILRWLLPIYNALDEALFRPKLLRPHSAFVLTIGAKE